MSDSKLKAYIDRILRSRVREDDEKANTKEIYKELAGEGYDKTIVGKVVNHLRKDESKAQEQSEKFDLYLTAYLGASHVHARVREGEPEHDADGVIIESTAVRTDAPNQKAGGQSALNAIEAGTQAPPVDTIHEPEAAMLPQTGAIETLVANSEPLVFDPADAPSGAATRKDAGTAAPNPITDLTQPNPICRDPSDCGVYASWQHPCLSCVRAAERAA